MVVGLTLRDFRSVGYTEKGRECGLSNMNAMLCVVIHDMDGRYDFAVRRREKDLMIKDRELFRIIRVSLCNNTRMEHHEDSRGYSIYRHGGSYFVFATWDEFREDPEFYLDLAVENRGHWEDFEVRKNIDPDW